MCSNEFSCQLSIVIVTGRWNSFFPFGTARANQLVQWSLLKTRIEEVCPSIAVQFVPTPIPPVLSRKVLLLQVWSLDRTGLLNGDLLIIPSILFLSSSFTRSSLILSFVKTLFSDVVQKLWELELTIHKVKVSTSPDNKSINLFFVTDNRDTWDHRDKLPLKKRAEEVGDQLKELLGSSFSHSEFSEASPGIGDLTCAPLAPMVANDVFAAVPAPTETEMDRSQGGPPTSLGGEETVVTVDNSISPVHTLLQITCKNRKGLVYDCLRTLRDVNLQVCA
jgi:hypothetical protein